MAGILDSYINPNSASGSSSASAYDVYTTLASQSTQQAAMANGALSSGLAFYQKKDYAKATAEFKRAIAMDPTNPQSYNFLGNTYLAQNKSSEAIKVYKTSLSIDPTQDKVHTNLANIYVSKKQFSDAEKQFKAAIKVNPTDTLAPYTLGQMYQTNGRYAEAENQFRQVIRMAPYDANPYYALGATLNKEGKSTEAVKQLTQAVRLKPKMAAAHLELGIAYGALGDTIKAQQEVETLTRLNAAQGALLKATIAKPKMVAAGGGLADNFVNSLGMNTPLYALDVSLLKPNSSKEFRLTFSFDSKMDPLSVQDAANWTITKASGGAAGYYNNTLPILPTEAYIPQNPISVVYDPDQLQATVTFMLSQNANGDATVDPAHMVFKFSGKDIKGKTMDSSADEVDGYSQTPI